MKLLEAPTYASSCCRVSQPTVRIVSSSVHHQSLGKCILCTQPQFTHASVFCQKSVQYFLGVLEASTQPRRHLVTTTCLIRPFFSPWQLLSQRHDKFLARFGSDILHKASAWPLSKQLNASLDQQPWQVSAWYQRHAVPHHISTVLRTAMASTSSPEAKKDCLISHLRTKPV